MRPSDSVFLDRLQADSIRYVIPVYQRMYSWRESNCQQLWRDIIAVGESEGGQHFTGSIVWVQDGGVDGSGEITALLIDGQQRMTTLSLLLIALADYAKYNDGKAPDGSALEFKWKRILNNYLLHDEDCAAGDQRRYKLALSEEDNATFHSLIDELEDESTAKVRTSDRITENYETMRSWLDAIEDPNVVWRGIRKLQVISVSLEQGKDNPQAIFESMNSTGKDLSAADLVRNYVLMGLPVKEQDRLYKNYWRPIERLLSGDAEDELFDEFLKDYLTVVCAPEPINYKDVYSIFKRRVISNDWRSVDDIELLLDEMKRYAEYYSRIALGADTNVELNRLFGNLARFGITVVNPLLLEFCDATDEGRSRMTESELAEVLSVSESYLVRRAVCDCATNSLNKFFSSVIAKLQSLDEEINYKDAFIALLRIEDGTARRFPDDAEFKRTLETRNLYSFRKVMYLLNRLENSFHAKNNPVDFSTGQYSIEHIMPQNALAHEEWIVMLGGSEVAQEVHSELLHTLGNLTVTAYNSELSDGTLEEKKQRMDGGFDHDVISLSDDCKACEEWNRSTIETRAVRLANRAVEVWPEPSADAGLVDQLGRKPKKVAGIGESVTLKMLVDEGYVAVGARLFHDGDAGLVTAEVIDEGKVKIHNGEVFNSPSMAAIRCISLRTGTKRTQNGWSYWRVDIEGKPLLDEIRKRYREDKGLDSDMGDWDSWHISFWEGFYEAAAELPGFCEAFGDLSERKPNRSYFCDLSSGTPHRHIALQVYTSKKNLGVACGEWFDNNEDYPKYLADKTAIEASVDAKGATWTWDPADANKKSRFPFLHKRLDVNDPAERAEAYDWMIEMAWAFRRIFG